MSPFSYLQSPQTDRTERLPASALKFEKQRDGRERDYVRFCFFERAGRVFGTAASVSPIPSLEEWCTEMLKRKKEDLTKSLLRPFAVLSFHPFPFQTALTKRNRFTTETSRTQFVLSYACLCQSHVFWSVQELRTWQRDSSADEERHRDRSLHSAGVPSLHRLVQNPSEKERRSLRFSVL